ncbi:hypothetical protein D9M70_497900 [compost metagenome]
MSSRCSGASPGTKGASTQAPSKDLEISQGRPFSFSFACTSRSVRSRAGAKPEMASRTSSASGWRDSGLPISTAISASKCTAPRSWGMLKPPTSGTTQEPGLMNSRGSVGTGLFSSLACSA